MPLKDLIDRQYGVKTDMVVNPLVTQVELTRTQLLKPNPNRLAWTLINLGANPIYVAFKQNVSTTKGIYCSATGGVIGLIWSEDFELVTYPIWGIVETATASIYLVEVVEV